MSNPSLPPMKTILILLILFVNINFSLAVYAKDEWGHLSKAEKQATRADLKYWLETMLRYYRYSWDETAKVTGYSETELKRFVEKYDIDINPPPQQKDSILVLPYPGGRHPRIGFLDGAIDPQRGTKAGIFLPWDQAGYIVVDLPEAIFSNLVLIYLAHTHIPTIWDEQNIPLENIDWTRESDGCLHFKRILPNKISFGASIQPSTSSVDMKLWLKNGTNETLTGLRTQICIMLKGAPHFNGLTNENKILQKPIAAVQSEKKDRWILTAWSHCGRVWANEDVPCMHSDPILPDCPPGETVTAEGSIWFYEGKDIESEINKYKSHF